MKYINTIGDINQNRNMKNFNKEKCKIESKLDNIKVNKNDL